MNAYDRGLFLWTEQCLCHVWLRNAAVLGDRGALCGPYVTTGCLEAAHRGGVSNGTQPTYMTVTSGGKHDQKILVAGAEISSNLFFCSVDRT